LRPLEAPPVKRTAVVLFGGPNSGKGTQAAHLTERHGGFYVGTGALLRTLMRKDGGANALLAPILSKGDLASDELVTQLVADELSRGKAETFLVVDGYPRRSAQCAKLEGLLSPETQIRMIHLKISHRCMRERAMRRHLCTACGRTGDHSGVCQCGGETTRRPDDDSRVLLHRIGEFESQKDLILSYYRDRGILLEVNGERDAHAVSGDLDRLLDLVI